MNNSTEARTARLTVKERVVAVLRRLDESCRECRRRGMAGTRCLECDLDGISATLADAVRCGGDDWCGDAQEVLVIDGSHLHRAVYGPKTPGDGRDA